ncbi:MAG: M48 family metalloprotease [Methylococcales bacterium]
MKIGDSREIVRCLPELDVGFVEGAIDSDELPLSYQLLPWCEDEIVLVLRKDHELALQYESGWSVQSRSHGSMRELNKPGFRAALAACVVPFAVLADEQEALTSLVSRYFDTAFLLKSAEYHYFELNLFLIQTCLLLTALFLMARGPLGNWSRITLKLTGGRRWLARAAILSMIYTSLALIRLPFSTMRYFHAHAYGLRNDSLGLYLLDWFKGFLIIWFIIIVLGAIILGLFARFPRWWTVLATAATGLLAIGYALFAPSVIEPLFYEFRPLEDPLLKQRLLKLSTCAGLKVGDILVANASRHSDSVNAYVTGIGGTARIVLYDTLLEKFNPDEIAIVLAHEIGHRAGAHIQKRLLFGIPGLLIALLIADRVFGHCVRKHLGGIASRRDPALVLPGYALYVVLTLMVLVPGNMLSRYMETQADRTALELSNDPDTFIHTKVRIAQANLSEVLPPAWVEFALFTHPSIARRIWMAENYRNNPSACER